MLEVKVYPDNINSGHISQIYTGLYDLEAQGKIKLKHTSKFSHELRNSIPYVTLWLNVKDLKSGKYAYICFDMHDSGTIHAVDRLHLCDVYFKRSYHQRFLDPLDANLQKKIFPYGLNYACRSKNQRHALQRLLIYNFVNNNFKKHPFRTFRDISLELIKASSARLFKSSLNLFPPMESEFEVTPDKPAELKILFQTHLWEPTLTRKISPNRLRQINDMRANTVRALRSEFGDRFIGGVIHTPFAKENYPDCLASEKTNKKNYMSLVKKCLIGVTTTGLHNSIGWSLPEYLAASKCILTEPLEYELPVSLKEGQNYLLFKTPGECVKMCKKILDNQRLANEMRYNNYKYYLSEVKPSALLNKCLETSLE